MRIEIKYLSHLISGNRLSNDPHKIKAIVNWSPSGNVKVLKGFLVLTGYYRKFVRNYSMIAKPCTGLLKKDSFQWNIEAESTFLQLKTAMVNNPILTLPDFSLPFTIETGASGKGIRIVLCGKKKSLPSSTKLFVLTIRQKLIYEMELMVVLHVVNGIIT